MSKDEIQFTVRGKPIPKGSKRFVGHGIIINANKATKPWQTLCAMTAADYAPEGGPWTGPVAMYLDFWMVEPRKVPKERLGYPTTKPDLLKIARAVEDALAGVIYKDDAQVVRLRLTKRYGPVGVDVRVQKILEPCPSQESKLCITG